MKYEIENYGYLEQMIIEIRYFILIPILLIGVIASDYFWHGLDLKTLKTISLVFAVIVITVSIHAYKKFKSKSYNYIDINNNELTIAIGKHVEIIPLPEISQCVEYNICGNKNFAIYHSDKKSVILLNGLKDGFVAEISGFLNGVKVKKSSIFETLKYIVRSFGKS